MDDESAEGTSVNELQSLLRRELERSQPSHSETKGPNPPAKRRRRKLDLETNATANPARIKGVAEELQSAVLDKIDSGIAAGLSRKELAIQLAPIVSELITERKLNLNKVEQRDIVTVLLSEMLGLGPLDRLLCDETINDIMVNGPDMVYVERAGKLELTDVRFRDNAHVTAVATRIANRIGRRIDERTPYVDARLADGSRVNIIAPPLSLKGTAISIRKFAKRAITLDVMARQNNLSMAMQTVLTVAARCRLNILISGGTGSGKTTLLNALSHLIDPGERVITIEDAAELQLQQPHVLSLETRAPNIEGDGEVTIRDLVRNALRMRPDRIVVGEIRGPEALDMLQAMNTGHDGSLGTIHANRPRDALARLENLVGMAGINLPSRAIRTQIANAVNLILQVRRMRDGVRRVTHISEIVGMEGDIIVMQDLFTYQFDDLANGKINGRFVSGGLRPAFAERAQYYGLDRLLLEALG